MLDVRGYECPIVFLVIAKKKKNTGCVDTRFVNLRVLALFLFDLAPHNAPGYFIYRLTSTVSPHLADPPGR